jgi:hypothetical protein
MSPRILRAYWSLSAVLTIQIALATQFVYLPVCVPSSPPPPTIESFPNVIEELDRVDLQRL